MLKKVFPSLMLKPCADYKEKRQFSFQLVMDRK